MLTIKTKPDCTLGFASVPYLGIVHDELLVMGHSPEDISSKIDKINRGDRKGFYGCKEAIGKLSEITEEQARELVETDPRDSKGFADYTFYKEAWLRSPKASLMSAALSVGIEEKDFDKYLIVKL